MKEAANRQQRVLILTPIGEDGAVLANALANDGLMPCICKSIEDICNGIEDISGTAIIAEEAINPDNIERLAQTIKRQPEWSDFPFIIMASEGTNPDRIWIVLDSINQSLNANVLKRPMLTRSLLAAVRSSLRSRASQYRVAEELRRRKEVEQSLTAANEQLKTFSYSVSHDLRAPLHIMKGFSTILLEDYFDKLDETGRDYLNRINRSVDQMSILIEDMLNLSRISRQDMTIQEVDLSALARKIIDVLRGSQPQRQVDVSIHDTLNVHGDKRLLEIALVNLLENSWKYTSKMPQSSIEFGNFFKDNETVYFIRDNGAGFSMQNVEKLFKPFQRLHPESEFAGSGIGLAIVHRVISRHGGRIWVESEEGKGTTFYFTLS